MLPPVEVTPPLSNAFRYSRATDLRCSSVMRSCDSAMRLPSPVQRRTASGCNRAEAPVKRERWAPHDGGPVPARTCPGVPLVGRYVLPQAVREGLQESVYAGGQVAHQVAGGDVAAQGGGLTRPQRREGIQARCLGGGTQRGHCPGRQREGG